MSTHTPSLPEYIVASRRIEGTHEEKLAQIEEAITELLDLKRRECGDLPGVYYIAGPWRPHIYAASITILLLLLFFILLIGSHPARPRAALAVHAGYSAANR